MWCTTECWDCEDKTCEHYISKKNLYFENQELKKKISFNEKSRRKMQQSLMKQLEDYKSRNEKAIEKLGSIRAFGLRSGKTLISTLICESIDVLQGSDENE